VPSGTDRPEAALDPWTTRTKATFGVLGLALLATAPLVPVVPGLPPLRGYAFVAGGLLVLWAATMPRAVALVVLGAVALAASLTTTILGHGDVTANRSALALSCGAAVAIGSAGRKPWMAVPFLVTPLLVVAPGPAGWAASHQAFAAAWTQALGTDRALWPGLPAGLALAGVALGDLRARPWTDVRPSALSVILACAGLVMASLVLASLLPDRLGFTLDVLQRIALLAGLLGWVGIAYQAKRLSFVWQAAAACMLVLVGALYADPYTRYPGSFDAALLVTVLASLMPALLAAVGLLVRPWIGKEPHQSAVAVDVNAILAEKPVVAAPVVAHVEAAPLQVGGFGPRSRPDEAAMGGQARD
jgi:hypothetical protein